MTQGKGAHVVFDASGMMFGEAIEAAALDGRVPIVAAPPEGVVSFNLRTLYRKMLKVHGIDTLRLDAVTCAGRLSHLAAGFESGQFKAKAGRPMPLSAAGEAYGVWRPGAAGGLFCSRKRLISAGGPTVGYGFCGGRGNCRLSLKAYGHDKAETRHSRRAAPARIPGADGPFAIPCGQGNRRSCPAASARLYRASAPLPRTQICGSAGSLASHAVIGCETRPHTKRKSRNRHWRKPLPKLSLGKASRLDPSRAG